MQRSKEVNNLGDSWGKMLKHSSKIRHSIEILTTSSRLRFCQHRKTSRIYHQNQPQKPIFGQKTGKMHFSRIFFALTLACFKKSSYFCIAIGSWCNGNTTGFGSVILGSNPGDPTKCADWLRYRRWRLARFCVYTPTYFLLVFHIFFSVTDYGITTIARQRHCHLRHELHCGAFS